MSSQVELNSVSVARIQQDVSQLKEAFQGLTLEEARRRVKDIESEIGQVKGEVGTLSAPLPRKMEGAYATLLALKERLEQKELGKLLEGSGLLMARGRPYGDERGTAPGSLIVGKALEGMLLGTLNSRDEMDRVLLEGSDLYDRLSDGMELGVHLPCEEVLGSFEGSFTRRGEVIQAPLMTGKEQQAYVHVLQELQGNLSGERIGAMLIIGHDYFGVTVGEKDICLFDPNSRAAPALLIQVESLEKAAEILAYRRSAFKKEAVVCFPVESKSVGELALVKSMKFEEKPLVPISDFEPVLTETNRSDVVSLIRELERVSPENAHMVQSILSRYETVKITRTVESGVEVKATVLVLKAELYFHDAKLLSPAIEEGRGGLRSPVVEEISDSEEEDLVFYDCVDYFPEKKEAAFERKRALALRASSVGTLFVRDHVLPHVAKEGAVNQKVIIEHVEEWFQSFLPTLFFGEGEDTQQQKNSLVLVTSSLHCVTLFLKDYNTAHSALLGGTWCRSHEALSAAEMQQRINQRLLARKDSDQEILEAFGGHLVNLFEAISGKPIGDELKGSLAKHTAKVLDALIDTVLSPEFSKMLTLGFIHDEKIGDELKKFSEESDSEIVPGVVPPGLQQEVTAFVSELIDFGNPRYSSWIASSMLKSHFLQTDDSSNAKSVLRFGMRLLSKPVFRDEIGAFLQNAFALQRERGAESETWVSAATVGISAVQRYGWDDQGKSLLGRVQDVQDIPQALYQKITCLARELGSKKTGAFLTATSWVMPSVHTFGQSLAGNLYGLSQSKPLMRSLTIQYIVQGALIPEIRSRVASIGSSILPQIAPIGPQDLSLEAGKRLSNLMGNYLDRYVSQLYLKDTPLVTSVVDLSVVMVKGFLPELIGKPQQTAFPKAKQQMIVDLYGSIGPFIHDYALAVQEAKKDETFGVYASEGKEERLVLAALEKVRGAPLKISERDVSQKLEAMTDLIIRSHCKGISSTQAQLVRSTAFVIPKLVKASLDVLFSPEMINALLVGYIKEFQSAGVEDPHHQYQSWDQEVLVRWNDSLFTLMKGLVQLGEPTGKMEEMIQSILGLSDGAQKNLGSLLARFSSGPSPLLAPAQLLRTVETLEKVLFDESQGPKLTNVFDHSDRKQREIALRSQLTGLMTDPLPMESLRSVAEGWLGGAVKGVMQFGQSAAGHIGTLSTIIGSQEVVSSEGPLMRVLKQEVQERTSGILSFLSPRGEDELSGGLQGLLQAKLSEALDLKEFALGKNPVMQYLDNTCSNVTSFFNSPALMRAFVYNYVLTPEFFSHLVANLDGSATLSESALTKHLPSSLVLDMCSLSWVLPGSGRSERLVKTPKMEEGIHFCPPAPTYDRNDCLIALTREFKASERLFAGADASTSLTTLYEKLQAWEKEGIVTPEFTRGCINNLENIPAFVEHLTSWMEASKVVSSAEIEALQGACKEGELPFVFRYLDLMISENSPIATALFRENPKGILKLQFLKEATTGLNGETIHLIEKMQLAKAFDKWMTPFVQENETGRRQMDAVLSILAQDKVELPFKDKVAFLMEKVGSYLEIKGVDALFMNEVNRCFKESDDPLKGAMQLFSIYRGVTFWKEKTEKIHETLGELRLVGSSTSSVMADIEPALKEYYANLGALLSELLSDPLSDKLKLAITNEFLIRYRSFSHSVAPKQGVKVLNSCSAAITVSSLGGNLHKLMLLENAQKSIIMSGCYFGGKLFDQALAKIQHGLETKKDLDVKLIGSEYMLTSKNKEKIKALETQFPDRFYMLVTPEVQLYSSSISDRTSYRTNHSKILVVDYGKYFEMGGSGIADRWDTNGDTPISSSGKREMQPLAFRDADFLFRSEETFGVGYSLYLELLNLFPVWGSQDVKERIKASFDPRFNHVVPPLFEGARSENIDTHGARKGVLQTTFYSTGPDDSENQMLQDLIEDVKGAEQSIHIQHMYFHPVPELLEALKGAAGRGVRIHLVTNRTGGDMPLTHELYAELSRSNWKELLAGKPNPNLHLYEFGVANTTYHKKIITIDGKRIYLGSTNMGEKSLRMNDHEINVRLDSPEMGKFVLQCFLQDVHPVYQNEWQGQGRHRRQVQVEVRGPLSPEVPQAEVLRSEINRAAIAEVQASFLQRWL